MILSRLSINLFILILLFFISTSWAQREVKPGGKIASEDLQLCLEKNYKEIQATPEKDRVNKIHTLCNKELNKVKSNMQLSYETNGKYSTTKRINEKRDAEQKALAAMLYKYTSDSKATPPSKTSAATITTNVENSDVVEDNATNSLMPFTNIKRVEIPLADTTTGNAGAGNNPQNNGLAAGTTTGEAANNKTSNTTTGGTAGSTTGEVANNDIVGSTTAGQKETTVVAAPIEKEKETETPEKEDVSKENAPVITKDGEVVTKAEIITDEDEKDEDNSKTGKSEIATQKDSEGIDVIHTDHRKCENPEWVPGIDKKIIGIDGSACSASQAGKRISACIRFVRCVRKANKADESDAVFLRQALCAPSECGDQPGQEKKCLASNHAIYLENAEGVSKKLNPKTGRSLMESSGKYKIKVNQ